MGETAEYLIDHYQKTYELTYSLWKSRNKTLLSLLAAVGLATLVSFPALGTRSILFAYLAHSLGLEQKDIVALQGGFPFGVVQAIFLFVIFYLTVNLYQRARYVLRNYAYLGALEAEIRHQLALSATSVAFTRESTFYWGNRDLFSGAVKFVYIVLLFGLLMSFFGVAIYEDWKSKNEFLPMVDILFAIPTLTFLVAYAIATVSMDTKQAIVSHKPATARGAH